MSTDNPEREYVFTGDSAMDDVLTRRQISHQAAFLVPFLRPQMSLVDVGCGLGTITVGFASQLREGTVAGFDTQADHIERATQLARDEGVTNVRFKVGDLFQRPFPEVSFDVAYANAVIEHHSNPEAGIASMRDLVKPGGLVALRDRGGGNGVLAGRGNQHARRALDIIQQAIDKASANPHGSQIMGELMHGLCRQAGLEVLSVSASWDFMPPSALGGLLESQFRERAIQLGITTAEEVDDLGAKLPAWLDDPDTYMAIPWFEVVARKP